MKNKKLEVTFLPVEKQTNGFNYGLFTLAYASILLDGKSPTDLRFFGKEMRAHYINCLKDVTLHPFPVIKEDCSIEQQSENFSFLSYILLDFSNFYVKTRNKSDK